MKNPIKCIRNSLRYVDQSQFLIIRWVYLPRDGTSIRGPTRGIFIVLVKNKYGECGYKALG